MAALLVLICLVIPSILRAQPSREDQLIVEKYSFGDFTDAYRILIHVQKWVYIADRAQHRILLFRDGQTDPTTIGGYGWSPSSFDTPSGIATDGLNIYVADYGNHRIQRFDRTLSLISSFSTRESDNRQARFGYPTGVALSNQGDLFILDSENVRVVRFSPRSLPLGSFGEIETRARRLVKPLKIGVSQTDRIYVLEPNRLVEYDPAGNFLRTIGEGILTDARSFVIGTETFLVVEPGTLVVFDGRGMMQRQISRDMIAAERPVGEFADAAIVEAQFYLLSRHRVHVFDLADIVRGSSRE